jgi:hypothetical protein
MASLDDGKERLGSVTRATGGGEIQGEGGVNVSSVTGELLSGQIIKGTPAPRGLPVQHRGMAAG